LDVLEHILDPESLMKEISRVLVEGGTLVVCVPNILNIFNRISFARGEFTDVMDVAHKNGELFSEHIRLFSKQKLETLLKNEGYVLLERHYYFPEAFTEDRWKHLQFLGNLVNLLRLPQIFPSLFALGFLYVCQKHRKMYFN
jgi:SAM-dependent methyltransferase